MREKIDNFLRSVFSIFVLLAILGGGIVFCMFVIGVIVGGETATNLSVMAKNKVMPAFIRCATIAMVAGLLSFYNSKSHTLSLGEEKKEKATADNQ